MPNRETSGSNHGSIRRRKFLAKGTAVASAALLAGCSGGDGGGDGGSNNASGGGGATNDSSDTSNSTGGGGATGNASNASNASGGGGGSSDYSGLTIQYWNRFHNNSGEANNAIRQAIGRFEEETGATVNVQYSSGEPGQRWLTLAREGNRPHIMDQVAGQVGPFVELEIIKPFSDYSSLFSDDLIEQTSWFMDNVGSQTYSGFGGNAYEFKFSTESPRLFLARRDHIEEAGLDPEQDFPPTSFQESIELGQTLQEDGPGDFGFQIYGTDSDVTDTCTEDWPIARGGSAGKFLNEDWSDTKIDNDAFKTSYENFVSILTEHELSSPGTVSMSDEDATQALIRGDASMTQVPSATYADLLSNAEQQVMNGNFVFGPAWRGDSGARGMSGGDGITFVNPPDGANQDEWQRAQEAAADLLENYLYFSDDFQARMFSTIGGGPIREDVGPEDIKGAVEDPTGYNQTNIIDAFNTCLQDQDQYFLQAAAPMFGQIQYEIMPGYIQQALQGQMSASEALDQAAQEARNQFFN